ncbi:HalOD1 output domain-containing protein [Natrarchaeobius oligotrophus]|uniref:Halobacterial output domain-containing protein n=1 Tax=Natrarchaeobius chitinivorans TaxID=1679083 RepID=A0A3N6N604_NATCH|nr:HalOD1 output domain-containing protein [Natrarchaeobius chitinivorans]RQH03327.1 hypothetical protein EA472_01745 [Natrarchaeobius chitinivorans]
MNSHSASTTVTQERSPSMAVVDLVARVEGVDPIELDPLYGSIDPDVLDSLCASSNGFDTLEFVYAGRTITIERTEDGLRISVADSVVGTDAVGVADTESST